MAATRSALQRFVRGIARPAWDRLGWDPRSSDPQRLSITLLGAWSLSWACSARTPECGGRARERFERYLSTRSGLAPDLLTPVANVVAASGGADGWDLILEK